MTTTSPTPLPETQHDLQAIPLWNAPSGLDLWVDVLCKRLSVTRHTDICAAFHRYTTPDRDPRGAETADRLLPLVSDPELDSLIAAFDRKVAERQAVVQPHQPEIRDSGSQETGPLPPQFAEKQLPAEYVREPQEETADAEEVPPPASPLEKFAPLPAGFMPVRLEQNGSRVVVISASQNMDPTGEISAGGYWIHLSEDGGKSWQAPLYTGLAEYYPYVIVPSAMPIGDGDVLNIEVAVQELDTSSITYPPIGLRSKRQARGLYIEVPLSALRRDTDGDGLTDTVETHVLLDPRNPDTDGDGIPDGRDAMPNVVQREAGGAGNEIVGEVLATVFSIRMGAIVLGVDTPADADIMQHALGRGIGDPVSSDRPIFVTGTPGFFTGLAPERMMLVYDDADLALLRRMTPDFHAVSLVPVVINDAGDRGFVTWSAGWVGGTYRVTRRDGKWEIESLSSWIS